MKLLVTDKLEVIRTLKPIFEYSYVEQFGDKSGEKFNAVVQDYYAATIIYEDLESRVVNGFCLHRLINTTPKYDSYLKGISEDFRKHLHDISPVMSIEWMTVAKEFRERVTKVRSVNLILGCSLELMLLQGFGGVMGFSRQDYKTDKVVMQHGFSINGVVDRFGIPCGVMLCEPHQVKDHHYGPTAQKVKDLWNSRIVDLTTMERKKAA